MEKLMIALVALAEAGVKYLETKKAESEGYLEMARRRAEKDLGAAPAAAAPAPAAAAAAQPPAEAPKKEKKVKKEAAAPAPAPAAAQPPAEAPKAPAVDPLGDTGPVAGAFEGAANPPAAPAPAAAQAPAKEMTETESYDKLIKTMGAFLQLNKSEADGGEAAREMSRGILSAAFKVAKIKDLTHPQRVEAIALFESKIAEVGTGKK